MKTKIAVIGAGFSGMSAATHLAAKGYEVHVIEKNASPGGRASKFEAEGFVFDKGPSWYWMPEVFDDYFANFGKKTSDYYELIRLNPSYQVFFEDKTSVDIPAAMDELEHLFESLEPGSAKKLKAFLKEAEYKYNVGIKEFVHKPSHSILEFADIRVIASLFRLQMFQSISKQIRSLFNHPKLVSILEFPVLFLGATPQKTPALYSLMNYADLCLGTWYPKGGMYKIVEGMYDLALEMGVNFHFNQAVNSFEIKNNKIFSVKSTTKTMEVDVVVNGADYHHIEQQVLEKKYQMYSAEYWEKRTMAPSSLLYYVGLNKRLKNVRHHNLFFDRDFQKHANEIYENPKWPTEPLFYACVPSVSDSSVALEGNENLFLLIPTAPGLTGDDEEVRNNYFDKIVARMEQLCGERIKEHIVFKKTYAHSNFIEEYNSFKGNAYGLANTLWQTAFLKPKMKHSKLDNLYFTGQLTVPGPGVPPSLISGEVVAKEVAKQYKTNKEKVVNLKKA